MQHDTPEHKSSSLCNGLTLGETVVLSTHYLILHVVLYGLSSDEMVSFVQL